MPGVLVTVLGPVGRLDVEVPVELPVGTLVDALVAALGPAGADATAGEWSLHPLTGDPLPAGSSLPAVGVRDGAVLMLADRARPDQSAPRSRGSATIAVLSASPGMGRTTVATLLTGALVAGIGQLTVAVDLDPGAGSLSERLAPGHDVTARDLLALLGHPVLTREELLPFLAWCGPEFALLASSPRRHRAPPLAERDWRRLWDCLGFHGLHLVLDCPAGLGDPGSRAAVAAADQVVLVVEPIPSPASRRMARALADRGLPMVAVPWTIPPGTAPVRPSSVIPSAIRDAVVPGGGVPGDGVPGRIRRLLGRGVTSGGLGLPWVRVVVPPRERRAWRWGRPQGGMDGQDWRDLLAGVAGVAGLDEVPARRWDQVWRVAEVLVADWEALGLVARPGYDPG